MASFEQPACLCVQWFYPLLWISGSQTCPCGWAPGSYGALCGTPWNTDIFNPIIWASSNFTSRKYDYINLCSIICNHKHTCPRRRKKKAVKLRLAVCVIYLLYLFAACSFMLLSPEAAQQSGSSRYQSFKKKKQNKNLDENTEHLWAAIWAMKVRKPLPAAQTWSSDLSSLQELRHPPALSGSPTATDISGWSTRFWCESAPTEMTSLLLYILQHP